MERHAHLPKPKPKTTHGTIVEAGLQLGAESGLPENTANEGRRTQILDEISRSVKNYFRDSNAIS
jgi:hypothetical protein